MSTCGAQSATRSMAPTGDQQKMAAFTSEKIEIAHINYPKTLPKSPIGQAMHYSLKYWTELTRFLEDGRLEVDNNLTEQKIKPFVIARKNFLFACSVDGAYALENHFSLIQTAIIHGLNPHDYYVLLLKRIPCCEKIEDYESLLPWNVKSEMSKYQEVA